MEPSLESRAIAGRRRDVSELGPTSEVLKGARMRRGAAVGTASKSLSKANLSTVDVVPRCLAEEGRMQNS